MSDRVTLIIPSVASRASYFRRVLIHLAQQGFAGPVIVSDHSAGDRAAVLPAIMAEFPQLDLSLRRHAPELAFLLRLADCAEAAATPYVVLHADDDFMRFAVLDLCTEHLDANGDTVMAKGRIAFFSCTDDTLGIFGQPGRSAPKPNMLSRLIRHLASFSATLYAVHRREPFIDSCRRAIAATENVIFWQYLQSSLMILEGKLKTFDELYYLEGACARQFRVNASGREAEMIPQAVLDRLDNGYGDEYRAEAAHLYFEALKRMLDDVMPGYDD